MPASVGELLSLAEDEVQVLTDVLLLGPEVRLAPVLRAWRRFDSTARATLTVTLGPRVPTHPVDFAVACSIRGSPSRATHTASESPAGWHLLRAGALVGAAGDLLAQVDAPADVAHTAAARVASLIAAAAYSLVVTGGRQVYTPSQDLAPVVRAHLAAVRVIDAFSGADPSSALYDVTAEPTSITYGAGARLSAAALRLRHECLSAEPSSEVFILSALATSRLLITAWQVLDGGQRGGLADRPLDEVRKSLRDAALAWREVVHDWRAHVVPGRRPESVRTAAAEFGAACDALASHSRPVTPTTLRESLIGVGRGLAQSVRLGDAQQPLPSQLGHAKLILVPARSLPASLDRLQSVIRGKYVAAPQAAGVRLTSNWDTALRLTRTAAAAVADVRPWFGDVPRHSAAQSELIASAPFANSKRARPPRRGEPRTRGA